MKLTVIIPCYNEEKSILDVLGKIRAVKIGDESHEVSKEVIVIDDGSKDRSALLLKAHPELYDVAIYRSKNGGKGAAVKAGLLAATGDYVLFQDSDSEYDPFEYPKLLFPVLNYGSDMVVGSRFLAPQIMRVHYLYNQLGNRVLTFFFNVLFNTTFTDIYSCYLLFRRDLVSPQDLVTMGFQQQAEILCHCVRNGRSFYEVAITYHGRTQAEGKKIKAYHIFGVIWTIICGRWQSRFRKRVVSSNSSQPPSKSIESVRAR